MGPVVKAPDDASADEATRFDAAASQQMERLVADFAQMYKERNEALEEVARAHHDALLRLAMAAEFKDDDTGAHIVRIGYLSEALALLLGERLQWATLLRKASPMHDIGKIGIPDAILKKPGPLTAEERQVMNTHPAIGASLLGRSRIPLFRLAAEVALGHHERFDGTGYPARLAGESIALSARIVSVVDFFDALTMDRVYRKALSAEATLQMMIEQRGKAFDPRIVDCFFEHREVLVGLRDSLNTSNPSFESLEGDRGFDVRGFLVSRR